MSTRRCRRTPIARAGRAGRPPAAPPTCGASGADRLMATLDCTGGLYSRQRCSGLRFARLLERAGPQPGASHVRVISHIGYRWSFDLRDARGLLLATGVGAEPLSHEHGAPARLVAGARPARSSVGQVGGSPRAARRTRSRRGRLDGVEQLHARGTRQPDHGLPRGVATHERSAQTVGARRPVRRAARGVP